MTTRIGATFEREIKNYAKVSSIFIRKIPTVRFRTVGNELVDFLLVASNIALALELKATAKNITSWPFSIVPPNQIKALREVHENGGRAFILISLRTKPVSCYYISILEYLELIKKYALLGRKSIPISEFKKLRELQRIMKPVQTWDLSPLYENEYEQ